MNSWFTIEAIDEVTYAISEYGHWEKVHSYLLIGETHALLIDTGLGIGNIWEEVKALTKLPIKVINTHAHWDHIGGNQFFQDIYIHRLDAKWLQNGLPIPLTLIRHTIIQEPFYQCPPEEFDIDDYTIPTGYPVHLVEDGEILDIGSRKVSILHTPGHSPGHICIWEAEKGYLYTGDLIYKGTLYANYPSTDPFLFKKSVDRISTLQNIKKILPAHNDLDIGRELISLIKEGFGYLAMNQLLKQGSGDFEFSDFKIKI